MTPRAMGDYWPMNTFLNKNIQLEGLIQGCKHFTWREALWLNSVQAYALPSQMQIDNIIKQARAMDKVREHFGQPVTVTSWLRPNQYNIDRGGASRSWHIVGLATDFVVKNFSCEEVKDELRTKHLIYPGRGEIDTTNWIHLDLGGDKWFYARAATT